VGTAGTGYGSGAAGAKSEINSGARAGAVGQPGIVIVHEYY
jgi:hypothetical protein